MRIVVLDGHTLNPGDLDWGGLETFGELFVFDRTSREDVVPRAKGADVVLTNKVALDRSVLEELSSLRYIGVLATGTNVVDLEAARQRGVAVTNVPGYGTDSVAQHTFALLLELTNQVALHDRAVRDGEWQRHPDFAMPRATLVELSGLTLGIVGLGHIGRKVAQIAQGFGMHVLATSRRPTPVPGVELTPLDVLTRRADVVSLHCPLTPETERLVDRTFLERMKPTAFLINTSRGGLIDEPALAEALREGRLAGAGLDVLTVEPPRESSPLIGAPRCVITPHVAWATHAARKRLMEIVVENVRAWMEGRAVNRVDL